ncbi:TlyA family RNA methyltransferase [Candidatus Dependentiae bacterium]|nr:TlyA family RNA methyltransferase [Candidatus Dependentiae bacterium]MBU4387041.1 TlyA family RNA methyltransferase [Candidatus Dependentiae bacterium]MCG2756691.1 TlyA family RNA methyltransferase [Candidatus Dependentiae bacterium]
MKIKKRLDLLVQEKYPQFTRNQIQSWILQGKVLVDGKVETKAGTQIVQEADVLLTVDEPKFVSRAGFKLEHALDHFNVDVKDLVILDAGISTGGFTDCMLQRGAKRIYGIDVGFGQVHEKVLRDSRLVLMEKTNLRNLEQLPELVDLVTLDLSFISILKVLPAVVKLLKPSGKIITLIKPQFEAGKENVGKHGLVKSDKVHQEVIEKIKLGMQEFGFKAVGVIESPILGASSGNKEFLALFER